MPRLKILFCFFILAFTVSGCRATSQTPPISRVVTQITVEATNSGQLSKKLYTAPDKMKVILNYLRKLDPYTEADIEPDTFRTDAYQITVSYSDGNNTVYRQIYNQYLQVGNGPWKRIDPIYGGALLPILSNMPGDNP